MNEEGEMERGREDEMEKREEREEREDKRERKREGGGGDKDAPRMPQEIISPPGCAASGNT